MLLKNSAIYLITSLIPAIAGFLLVPFYLKYISVEEFGYLSVILMINTFITIFATMQLHSSIVKYFLEYKDDKDKQKRYLSSLLFFSVFISILFAFGIYILFDYLKSFFELDNLSNNIIVLGVSIAFINGFKVFFESINRILQHSKDILVSNIISTFILAIVAFILLYFYQFKLDSIVIAMLLSSIFGLIYYIFLNKSYIVFTFDFSLIKEPIRFAIALIPHTLSKNIYVMADRLILVKFVSMGDVGIYAIIDKIANIVKLLTSNFGKAFTPYFMNKQKNNETENITNLILFTNYFFLGILLGLSLFINLIISFVESTIINYAYLVIILSTAFIFKNLEMYLTNFLLDNKQTKYISIISFSAAILNIVLNLIFIPKYGIIAATVTTTISYFIGFLVAYYFVDIKFKYIKLPILKLIQDFIFVSILVVLVYFNQNLYGVGLLGLYLIYGYFNYFKIIKNSLLKEKNEK